MFLSKKCSFKNIWTLFLEKILLVSLSQRNSTAYFQLLIKEQFSHKFPRHWAMRGPCSLLQLFLRVHNCSKPVQSRSWSQEKKGRPFPKAIDKLKVQTVPERIRPLIKPLYISKTVFSHISKALGHERVQFTLVGLISGFTIAANFFRADPGTKRRKKSLLQKHPFLSLLFLFLFLFLSLSLFVPLNLPLPLLFPLRLSLSLSFSFSLSLALFLSLPLTTFSLKQNLWWKR